MDVRRKNRLSALLLVAIAAVGLARTAPPSTDASSVRGAGSATPGGTGPSGGELSLDGFADPRGDLRVVAVAPPPLVVAGPLALHRAGEEDLPQAVTVHGRATFGITPAEGVVLSVVDAHGDEVDWDFTDVAGEFHLRLAPATYRVVHSDLPGWSTELVVPLDRTEIELSLLLPTTLWD